MQKLRRLPSGAWRAEKQHMAEVGPSVVEVEHFVSMLEALVWLVEV